MSRFSSQGRHAYSPEFMGRAQTLAWALYAVAYNASLGDCEFEDLEEDYQVNYMLDAIDVMNLMPHLLPAGSPEWDQAFPTISITKKEMAR